MKVLNFSGRISSQTAVLEINKPKHLALLLSLYKLFFVHSFNKKWNGTNVFARCSYTEKTAICHNTLSMQKQKFYF